MSTAVAMDCFRDEFKPGVVLNDRFETVAPLNQGSFGLVVLAKDRLTGEKVAIKCISRSSAGADQTPVTVGTTEESCDELYCHQLLGSHRNIVNLVDSFETASHSFLALEYCPMGDLYEAIRMDRGPLQTENVRDFMLQLIEAVEYMHSKGLYHRDIKPENIFLTASGDIKLGDFGLATTRSTSFEACVGSDRYMAPEQYDPPATGYSPAAADVWSVGICLLNVLFAKNPFVTPTQSDVLFADFVRDRQSLFDVFPSLSQDTFNILTAALSLDPAKRSLSELKRRILLAQSFTTDDDVFDDDFCTMESRNSSNLAVAADREPLRTPSIQSPMFSQAESFPWAKALQQTTPQQPCRQLSAIPDDESYNEDLFDQSETQLGTSWFTVQPGTSLRSDLTSVAGSRGYGSTAPVSVPVATANAAAKAKANASASAQQAVAAKTGGISESVPVRPKLIPSISQFFGKSDLYSKSWSDLWEEEEELESLALRERQAQNARTYSQESISKRAVATATATEKEAEVEIRSGSDSGDELTDSSSSTPPSSASGSASSSSSSLLLPSADAAELAPVLLDVPPSVVNARVTTPHAQQQQSALKASFETPSEQTTPISTPRPHHRSVGKQSVPRPMASSLSAAHTLASKLQQTPRSPPKEPSMDQWAALGNRRRNVSASKQQHQITPRGGGASSTPAKSVLMMAATARQSPAMHSHLYSHQRQQVHKKQSMNDNWRQGADPLPASWGAGGAGPLLSTSEAMAQMQQQQPRPRHAAHTTNHHQTHRALQHTPANRPMLSGSYQDRKLGHIHVHELQQQQQQHHHQHSWRHDPLATIKPRKAASRPAIDFWADAQASDEDFDFVGGWQDLHI
ncbi:hypothetical protein KEM52_000085 [Ascosphaera acerosa]|nr:hypothetical protein KEM52_000085 [Ascosphaera acerosa]